MNFAKKCLTTVSNLPPVMYGRNTSPACRAVLITANALNVKLDTKYMDLSKNEHLEPNYLKLNPQHTIPTLDDNGFVIWDSHVITTYLINKYAETDHLYPKDPQKRALVDLRLHFDNSTALASLLNIVKPLKQKLFKQIPTDKADDVKETYRLLEIFLANNNFVVDNNITVADFHLLTTITSLDLLVPIGNQFTTINKWISKCKEYPWYNINEEGLENFRKLFHGLMYS